MTNKGNLDGWLYCNHAYLYNRTFSEFDLSHNFFHWTVFLLETTLKQFVMVLQPFLAVIKERYTIIYVLHI